MATHTLIFASNNQHKVDEIKNIVRGFEILTLRDAGITIDIPEPHDTLEANASEKAAVIHKLTGGKNCFSEDTGLEVAALKGEPGVKSARYAGEGRDFKANIDKLLRNLEGQTDRRARFRTVISLIWHTHEYLFEGQCTGKIIDTPRGDGGFGYDAVFVPDGNDKTFAEMTMEEKNGFSHRKKAVDKLTRFLNLVDEEKLTVPAE